MPKTLPQREFIFLLAMLFATLAFSIDAMLPALPEIAGALTPSDPNRAQFVIAAFMLGMGVGTLVAGPISDAIGRRPTIFWGLGLFSLGAILASFAPNLEMLLAARVLQGLGAAAPRIVGMTVVRDLYAGREMAKIISFVMLVFLLVPAIAPALGAVIIHLVGWRALFGAFVVFAAMIGVWFWARQSETLAPENRRPFRIKTIKSGLIEVISHRQVMVFTLVLTLGMGQMFALLMSTQQVYAEIFNITTTFPLWFAATALLSGTGTMLNAKFVMALGMRKLTLMTYVGQVVISGTILALHLFGMIPAGWGLWVYFFWSSSIFFMAGLTFGNLNALALQPLGHMAGLAASAVTGISTVASLAVAVPIGAAFNGTTVPLLLGAILCSAACAYLVKRSVELA